VIVRRIWILLFLKQFRKIRCLRRGLPEDYGHAGHELRRIYGPSIVFDPRVGISTPGQDGQACLLRKGRGRRKDQQEQDCTSYSYGPSCLQLLPQAEHIPPILRIGSEVTNPHQEIT
jgi:hypothetical protein